MDAREFVAFCMERNRRNTLETIKGLSQEDLVWQPHPAANPMGFLLFHILRTEDRYVHRVLPGEEEMWERNGWDRRWVLPPHGAEVAPEWPTGQTWTMEQVTGWEPPPLEEMLEYAREVRESSLEVVRRLDPASWEEPLSTERPEVTRAFHLRIVVRHESQHQGQVDYVAGLLRAARGSA